MGRRFLTVKSLMKTWEKPIAGVKVEQTTNNTLTLKNENN